MGLKLYKRGEVWWVSGTIAGRQIRRSTGYADRGLARQKADKIERELVKRDLLGEQATFTFSDAVIRYIKDKNPAEQDRKFITLLMDRFEHERLCNIEPLQLATFADQWNRKPASTKRMVYTPFNAIWANAAEHGMCASRKFRFTGKIERKPIRWLTPTELERCVQVSPPHVRVILNVLAGTGLRERDALCLQWENVNLDTREARVWIEKQDKWLTIPLQPRVIAALSGLHERAGSVLLTRKGVPFALNASGGGVLRKTLMTAAQRAGLDRFSTHDLRHTWATWHYAVHKDIYRTTMEGGWSKVQTVVDHYQGHASEGLRQECLQYGWSMQRCTNLVHTEGHENIVELKQ